MAKSETPVNTKAFLLGTPGYQAPELLLGKCPVLLVMSVSNTNKIINLPNWLFKVVRFAKTRLAVLLNLDLTKRHC